ncbi:MAG: S-layer homology domain-containing protein [Candidatus Caenarcaniphilales bacterium]|nr:S-layer homology domain-containing protein [Candidatus Caenarcaniphilales bacterium]
MNSLIRLDSFFISCLFILAFVLPSFSYSDLKQDDWSYQAIMELSNKYGVLVGYPDGRFRPKKNITREEAAAEIYKLVKWVESHPNSVSVDDLRRMNSLINDFRGELTMLQNEVRSLRTEQEVMKARIEEVDARLDWNLKNRGLVHMLAMGTGKLFVGAGKDVITLGKGTVWLFTLGKVNLFDDPYAVPDPVDKTNRYNGPIQFLNGSAM